MSRIVRIDNAIKIYGELGNANVHYLLARTYEAFYKLGYQDIVQDFTKCTAVFPAPMAALCAQISKVRREGVSCYYIPPEDSKIARLFSNANYAHLLDSEQPRSRFLGYTKVPLTQYRSVSEQSALVNRMVECILTSMPSLNRGDMAAIEWAINEITDNVIVHSESPVGGFAQLTTYGRHRNKSVEFVVCDSGMGIPSSLRPSHDEISSDLEALECAIKEGVTRDKSIGQGNGLFGSFEICRKSEGYFHIHSGHGRLELNRKGLRIIDEKIPLQGTLIIGRMNCIPDILQDALNFKGIKYEPVDYVEIKYESNDTENLEISILKEARSVGARQSGTPIRRKIIHLLQMCRDKPVVLDFSDIPLVSSSFADEVVGKLFVELGAVEFMNKVRLKNLNTTVRSLVDRAIVQRSATGL